VFVVAAFAVLGFAAAALAQNVPAYLTSILSDKAATDINAFLRSLPGRKLIKDFPLLNQ
jgi:hypothetical protein